MKLLFCTLTVLSLAMGDAWGDVIEEGSGVVYGKTHAFSFKAPKGWMLDNESGVQQGMHAVFYPKGSTWKTSKVVAYAQARAITETVKTADDAVKITVESFRAKGHPKYEGKFGKKFKTEQGKEVSIYFFSGDKWGNFEAAAYAVEEKTINFLVFNAREEKDFKDALPAFEALAKSYFFLTDNVNIQKNGVDQPEENAPK